MKEPAPICAGCGKPLPLCVCEAIEPIGNRIFVLILQHPQEKAETLGTAGLLHRQLRNSMLKVGLSWPGLRRILGREVDHRRWGVLYLGPVKAGPKDGPKPEGPILLLDRKGAPVADPRPVLRALEGIVVLDGTWSQAKTLWWRNPWMIKLQRLVLRPDFRSRYGALRREPRADAVSTLEAAAFALAALGREPALMAKLTRPFDLLVEKQRAARARPPAPGGAAPDADAGPEPEAEPDAAPDATPNPGAGPQA